MNYEKVISLKPHSIFPSELLDQVPSFKEYIQIDATNNKRFICKVCQKQNPGHFGFYDNLLRNLSTVAHEITTPDKEELEKGINQSKAFRNRNIRRPNMIISPQNVSQV